MEVWPYMRVPALPRRQNKASLASSSQTAISSEIVNSTGKKGNKKRQPHQKEGDLWDWCLQRLSSSFPGTISIPQAVPWNSPSWTLLSRGDVLVPILAFPRLPPTFPSLLAPPRPLSSYCCLQGDTPLCKLSPGQPPTLGGHVLSPMSRLVAFISARGKMLASSESSWRQSAFQRHVTDL